MLIRWINTPKISNFSPEQEPRKSRFLRNVLVGWTGGHLKEILKKVIP